MSDTDSNSGSDDESQNDLTNPDIVTKYRMAGDFTKAAMAEVIAACQPGAKVVDLCLLGDTKITDQTDKVYTKSVEVDGKKQPVDKGVAFPTSVSLNGVLSCFCPIRRDDQTALEKGDIAKIELAAHIDGYVVSSAHTVVVGEEDVAPRNADVIVAARQGLEAAMRCLRPGKSSAEIVAVIEKVAKAYGVEIAEGPKVHNVKRFVIEASKQVPIKTSPEENPENFDIEENEVYALEIAMATSEDGKFSHKDGEVHVYRRAVDVNYSLKMKSARQVFTEINNSAPSFPFSARMLQDKLGASAKLGMREIVEHDLLHPYPVVVCKGEDDRVATFKATCLVLSSGVTKLADTPYPEVESQKKIEDEEVLALLSRALKPKKKKKKNKN